MAEASQVAMPRTALAVAFAATLVAALLALTLRPERPVPAVPSPAAGADPDTPKSASDAAASLATARPDAAEPDAAEPDAPDPTAPETAAPAFDVVRVAPDGAALVAGTAAPGTRVTIRSEDGDLGAADADADGNFVAMFRAAPSATPRTLTLEVDDGQGGTAVSEDVVVLLPDAGAIAPTAAAAPPAAAEDATTPGGEAGAAPAAPVPEVAVTAILRDGAVEVTPAAPRDPTERQVTLASISYGATGEVSLSGAGTAGAPLRAYIDGALAREAEVGPDGRWSFDLGDVARGLYRLRIDQIAPDGRVASRVETPFQRDLPAAPPRRPGGGLGLSITVQPGANLWTIARTHYGSGVRYTQIFTANRELIRDPDLIYPGQVLALPAAEETD